MSLGDDLAANHRDRRIQEEGGGCACASASWPLDINLQIMWPLPQFSLCVMEHPDWMLDDDQSRRSFVHM